VPRRYGCIEKKRAEAKALLRGLESEDAIAMPRMILAARLGDGGLRKKP
jgi:hypothetical protein